VAQGTFDQVIALPTGWAAEGERGVRISLQGQARDLGEGPVGLTAAVAFADGILLATESGLWFAGDAGTALSPLDGAAPGATGLAVDGDDLWLAGDDGLHLWRDGQLSAVAPEGLATQDARIAAGGGVLWVASGSSLWRLWSDDSGWRAEVAVEDVDHSWLAGGNAGVAWASTGVVIRRAAPQALAEYAAPEHLGLAVGSSDVWLWDAEALWRLEGHTLWPVEGVENPSAVAAAGDGAAWVATATGLVKVTVGEVPTPEAPTWSGDVLPLFDARCDSCHGERGNARRLDDIDSFSDQVDLVLIAVREQRMPLPPNEPLTDAEIDLIVRWQEAEFPE
jgi:mono/diheme cytochrome c family protein